MPGCGTLVTDFFLDPSLAGSRGAEGQRENINLYGFNVILIPDWDHADTLLDPRYFCDVVEHKTVNLVFFDITFGVSMRPVLSPAESEGGECQQTLSFP